MSCWRNVEEDEAVVEVVVVKVSWSSVLVGWSKCRGQVVVVKVVAQFFKSFVLKAGFLDGYTGWTISRLSAYATYRKYRKLMLLHAQG